MASMEWIGKVLTNEFFWGVVVGVVLTAIGAWLQARLTIRQQKEAQKDLIRNFCIDRVNNIKAVVEQMADYEHKANVIQWDYLMRLDIEMGVFNRNREHTIHLPNPVRDEVTKFVNDCAARRSEIGHYQSQFYKLADQLQNQGQAQQVRNQQQVWFGKAVKALDQLAVRVKDGPSLLHSLKAVR
jgi:hypothetical protein